MEVTGRRESSDYTPLCQPCQGDGDTEQAEGYCENCTQFICSSCIKAHRRLPLTKTHVIKSKEEMPKILITRSDPCTELCDVHRNEVVKYYCKEHKSVGCGDCMRLEHISCKVQLVADVSGNYSDSDEFVLIKHRIKYLKKNLTSCKEEINLSLKTADEIKTKIIQEIQQFREEMDAYLDKVKEDLIQDVEKLNASDISSQQKLLGQCKETIEDIENMQRKLEQCKDNVNNLFVSSHRIKNQLQKCQKMNEEISSKSQISMLKFTPTEDLNALKRNHTRFGNLDTQMKKFSGQCEKSIIEMKAQFVKAFNMRTNCDISGMAIISESEILCADAHNTSLKVFNYKDGKITSALKTSSPPADVTTINSSYAAATLYDEGKILFLNTQNGLSASHSLKVREYCCGIDHRNGIMAVTFHYPPAVQVIAMEGNILHEVTDTSILKYPQYVCLSNDNESMFVSDFMNSAVYEFTINGRLINTMKSKEMKNPAGITVTNNGDGLVCDPYISDKVGVIIPGSGEICPFILQHVQNPVSVLICEEQKIIFINEIYEVDDTNTCSIKLFHLK